MAFELSPDRKTILEDLLPRYPTRKALTLPLLHLCQEQEGFVTPAVVAYVARTLDVSTAHVEGVVTFYTLYMQKKVGRNVIWVCRTLSCELTGAPGIQHALEEKLGCHVGETTADGVFTLLKAECLAACGGGPMVQLNDEYHEHLTPAKLDAILDAARKRTGHHGAIDFSPVGLGNPRPAK